MRSIVALADAFELDVVAEGVETVAAEKTLLDLGCYRAQGFLLSRPLHSAAMESLLRQTRPVTTPTAQPAGVLSRGSCGARSRAGASAAPPGALGLAPKLQRPGPALK